MGFFIASSLELTVEPWIDTLWPALHRELGSAEEQVVDCSECARLFRAQEGTSDYERMDNLKGSSLIHSPALESVALTMPPKSSEFLSLKFVDPVPDKVSRTKLFYLFEPYCTLVI